MRQHGETHLGGWADFGGNFRVHSTNGTVHLALTLVISDRTRVDPQFGS